MKLVECVPNFSEGRDKKVLDAIADVIRGVKGATLLDVDPGVATNRTVFTFVGEPDAAVEAAFQAIKKAAELIDMSKHKGEHARMGATDVCPFIPVSGMSMDECVELAKRLGKRVGDELGIPVYLYEYAASKPEWQNLAEIRKGEYEALPEKMNDPQWKPDFGPQAFNARSGATVIGARDFLIAYNINLNTRDTKKAQALAVLIREKPYPKKDENGQVMKDADGNKIMVPGLFRNCKAVGWYIEEYHRAQISINLTNYLVTPPHIVLEKVRELAAERGIQVTGSELVGLIPREAMIMAGKYYLNRLGESTGIPERMIIENAVQSMGLAELSPFDADKKVIEYCVAAKDNLTGMTLAGFCDELSTDSPAPGGGSVAALCGAISGALSAMVANLTIGKKGYEGVQEQAFSIADDGQVIKDKALGLIDRDTRAFYDMMDAIRLPKGTDEEKATRATAIEMTTQAAILIPLETMKVSLEAAQLSGRIAAIGNTNALSDAGVAAITANAACKGAYLNVRINMGGITEEAFKCRVMAEAEEIVSECDSIAMKVEKEIRSRV